MRHIHTNQLRYQTGVKVVTNEMKRTIQRARKSNQPKSPKTIPEVAVAFEFSTIMESFGYTHSKKDRRRFYRHTFDSEAFGYCVFASESSIELMEKNIPQNDRKLYVDATFKVRPNGDFQQLLIIFVEIFKEVIEFFVRKSKGVVFFFWVLT